MRAVATETVALETVVMQDVLALVPALRAYARGLTRNRIDADDLVQETLVKAIANIDRFQPGTRLRAWLFTIMRNTFYNNAHRARREVTGIADCVSGEVQVAPDQEGRIYFKQVMAAVENLPVQYREMVVLVLILGERYEDAAVLCSCAVGTVKSRVSRGRMMIMAALEEN